VSILLNTANQPGVFVSANVPLVQFVANTYAIALANLDGDVNGNLDLVSVQGNNQFAVRVALGDGTGGFGPTVSFPSGGNPYSVTAVDVDGDLDLDLVAPTAGNVNVLMNQSTPNNLSFAAPVSYPNSAGNPNWVASANLNQDADVSGHELTDIVLGHQDGAVSIMPGDVDNGGVINGTFTYAPALHITGGIDDGSASDINCDSYPDLLLVQSSPDLVSAFLNSTPGSSPVNLCAPQTPATATVTFFKAVMWGWLTPADFPITVTGSTVVSGHHLDKFSVPAGTYSLTEGGQPGYVPTYGGCFMLGPAGTATNIVYAPLVTFAAGETWYCGFINELVYDDCRPVCPSSSPETTAAPTATLASTPSPVVESPTPHETERTPTPAPTEVRETGMLCVIKFEDVDGDGHRGANEALLSGWEINIDDNIDWRLKTVESPEGICIDLPEGTHFVEEIPQAGWTQTTPLPPGLQPYDVKAGQVTTVEFGNRRQEEPSKEPALGRLCIIKFEDSDGDGRKGEREALLEDWKFKIDGGSSGSVFSTLDPEGTCIELTEGDHTIDEVIKAGWTQTAPLPAGTQVVTIRAGDTITIEFGNQRTER
jgi:hypothetical protein